jgi:hypothetical protein
MVSRPTREEPSPGLERAAAQPLQPLPVVGVADVGALARPRTERRASAPSSEATCQRILELRRVTATLAGYFPGSPVELEYEFTLANDAIEALRIHP